MRGLTKNYSVGRFGRQKVVRALSDMDLSVKQGEVLGLVGESGSGKTTFARTVAVSSSGRPPGEILVRGGPATPAQHASTARAPPSRSR